MTKILTALATALVLTAGAASANTFGLSEVQSSDTLLNLGTVVADGAGVVEIYDRWAGQQGQLLGAETVRAGANRDLRVPLRFAPHGDVVALLKVDGQVVAQQVIRMADAR
ncbi:MAG TPA: hypothetical protein VM899_01770 [Rubellimicrobium sp.]|jgi:hypothetical protein|nr:hypothetical protein [Rubellimicrobium sp.]